MLLYLETSTRKDILSALWLDLCHLWLILGVFSNVYFSVLFRTPCIPGLGAVNKELQCGRGSFAVWDGRLVLLAL